MDAKAAIHEMRKATALRSRELLERKQRAGAALATVRDADVGVYLQLSDALHAIFRQPIADCDAEMALLDDLENAIIGK